MGDRIYNFSAGPSMLPLEVLQKAGAEITNYHGCGMSVMEMSHRSAAFKGIIETAEADLRDLMSIPDNYKVLFLQGGATQQFAAIPMNLMLHGKADYIVSGSWSKKAYKEAQLFGDARCVGVLHAPDAVDAVELRVAVPAENLPRVQLAHDIGRVRIASELFKDQFAFCHGGLLW